MNGDEGYAILSAVLLVMVRVPFARYPCSLGGWSVLALARSDAPAPVLSLHIRSMNWSLSAPDFAADGGLRDICVPKTTVADWQRVLDWLRSAVPSLEYRVNDQPAILPESAADVFAVWTTASPSANFSVGGVNVTCHFFGPEEIEFDFVPNEVTGLERLEPLLDFMRELGRLTGKRVLLTPENWRVPPIFVLEAGADRVEYQPSTVE